MNLFTFMSEHPILTFFLALILVNGVVEVFKIMRGHYLPEHCDDCSCEADE